MTDSSVQLYKTDLEKANRLHVQWSLLEKAAKVAYVRRQWQFINEMVRLL